MRKNIFFLFCVILSATVNAEYVADEWWITRGTSPIDDSKTVVVDVASAPVIADYGRSYTFKLTIRCMENKTEAYINFGDAFMSDSYENSVVTFRLDKEKAFNLRLTASTDNKALFIPKPISFIKGLYNHDTLLIRGNTFAGNVYTTTFSMKGADKAFKELRETCKW